MSRNLTRDRFTEYKSNYEVYGVSTVTDVYGSEYTEKDSEPKETIYVMWQPLTGEADIAEYGQQINSMYFCIVYDDPDVTFGDIITIGDYEYEVVGIKLFNTYTRIDVSKKVV